MVNNISVIGAATAVVTPALPAGLPVRPEGQNLGAGVIASTPQTKPLGGGSGVPDVRRSEYAAAQSERDARNQLAQATRDEADRLARLETGLAGMKAGLEAIVKHYPPYLADSPERVKLLNQVSGLRKEIEALDVSRGGDAGSGRVTADKNPTDALPGLDKLPGDVISDEELTQYLDKVDSSQAKVAEARQKMWADLQAFVGNESDAQAVARSGESSSALAQGKLPITTQQAKGILATLL